MSPIMTLEQRWSVRSRADRLHVGHGRKPAGVKSPRKLSGSRGPSVDVQFHRQVWNRGWIPKRTLMDKPVIYPPSDLARGPFDGIPMHTLRSVEAQLDVAWGTSVAVVELGAFIARVVEDVDEETIWHVAGNFDVNFLMWRVTVKKKPSDHPWHVRRLEG